MATGFEGLTPEQISAKILGDMGTNLGAIKANPFAGTTGEPLSNANLTQGAQQAAQYETKVAQDTAANNLQTGVASQLDPVAEAFNQFGQNANVQSNVDPAFRQYQLQLAQQLQAQASGQGPSLAQMQLQQATDRSLNQNLGMIRSATGANAGLSARTASLAGAQQLGAAGNASGQLALQEQQGAQAALAGLANQGRTGDINVDSNSIQAQSQTGALQMGALNGLADVKIAQANPNTTIYQTNAAATAQDKQIAADAAMQASQQAAARDAARKAGRTNWGNILAGAAGSAASAGAASWLGTPAKK